MCRMQLLKIKLFFRGQSERLLTNLSSWCNRSYKSPPRWDCPPHGVRSSPFSDRKQAHCCGGWRSVPHGLRHSHGHTRGHEGRAPYPLLSLGMPDGHTISGDGRAYRFQAAQRHSLPEHRLSRPEKDMPFPKLALQAWQGIHPLHHIIYLTGCQYVAVSSGKCQTGDLPDNRQIVLCSLTNAHILIHIIIYYIVRPTGPVCAWPDIGKANLRKNRNPEDAV